MAQETEEHYRQRRAKEEGYPSYEFAHDAVRQRIDDEIERKHI